MSMKINKLEIENVKRIKAVKVEPKASGLTVIGGNNNQGKTSVLDSIAWALGGERYKPSQATREGSVIPPTLHIVMNNGLTVQKALESQHLPASFLIRCLSIQKAAQILWMWQDYPNLQAGRCFWKKSSM